MKIEIGWGVEGCWLGEDGGEEVGWDLWEDGIDEEMVVLEWVGEGRGGWGMVVGDGGIRKLVGYEVDVGYREVLSGGGVGYVGFEIWYE